jgi:hypothetical protein
MRIYRIAENNTGRGLYIDICPTPYYISKWGIEISPEHEPIEDRYFKSKLEIIQAIKKWNQRRKG